jgi:hypothetical protein
MQVMLKEVTKVTEKAHAVKSCRHSSYIEFATQILRKIAIAYNQLYPFYAIAPQSAPNWGLFTYTWRTFGHDLGP